jgi:hypothetical protein
MTDSKEDPEATRVAQEWAHALDRATEEDQRLLALLRLMSQLVDARYEMKGVRLLVGRALVDPEFRARALADADAAVAELRDHVELPEGVRLRCVENSADYLTIVLPPPSTALPERSRTLRDVVFSRTSADLEVVAAAGTDDNDVMPLHLGDPFSGDQDSAHFGDPSHDG